MKKKPVIRTMDIETAPNLAHVWNFFNTNVGLNQVMEDGEIMSFAYKDMGGDWIYYEDLRDNTPKQLIKRLCKSVDEADIIIGHNFRNFDMKWIRGAAAKLRLRPPSEPIIIDTLKAAREAFYLPSYRLEYMSRVFGCAPKSKHKKFPGHDLWVECLKGNEEAWDEMEEYNCQDVETNEELYTIIRPWIKAHPNMGLFLEDEEPHCPKCGSTHLNYRGYYYTAVSRFRKFQCQECGGWGRERTNDLPKSVRKKLVRG